MLVGRAAAGGVEPCPAQPPLLWFRCRSLKRMGKPRPRGRLDRAKHATARRLADCICVEGMTDSGSIAHPAPVFADPAGRLAGTGSSGRIRTDRAGPGGDLASLLRQTICLVLSGCRQGPVGNPPKPFPRTRAGRNAVHGSHPGRQTVGVEVMRSAAKSRAGCLKGWGSRTPDVVWPVPVL